MVCVYVPLVYVRGPPQLLSAPLSSAAAAPGSVVAGTWSVPTLRPSEQAECGAIKKQKKQTWKTMNNDKTSISTYLGLK